MDCKFFAEMKQYRDGTGEKIAVVEDLSFLSDREHFNWIQIHYRNLRHRRACRRADIIFAADDKVALDIVKYYFIPKDRIRIMSK